VLALVALVVVAFPVVVAVLPVAAFLVVVAVLVVAVAFPAVVVVPAVVVLLAVVFRMVNFHVFVVVPFYGSATFSLIYHKILHLPHLFPRLGHLHQ